MMFPFNTCNLNYRVISGESAYSWYMNKTIMVLIVLIVLGAGGYFVMKRGSGYNTSQVSTTAVATPTLSVSAGISTGVVKNFAVTGTEFAFVPETLSVNKGDTMSVTFTNTGKYPHNFVIKDLNVEGKTIQPGESDIVTFIADKAGTFTYICSVPTHKDKGMTGTLTVR